MPLDPKGQTQQKDHGEEGDPEGNNCATSKQAAKHSRTAEEEERESRKPGEGGADERSEDHQKAGKTQFTCLNQNKGKKSGDKKENK